MPQFNRATVVAVLNLKGGVGKTTTAVHLAASLSRNAKVLLIDLDLQASASLYVGLKRQQMSPCVAEWLFSTASFARVKKETAFPDLSIVPASSGLLQFDQKLAGQSAYFYRLKRRIEEISLDYDYILLDCPPSFSLITLNALAAAQYFIAPVSTQYMAFEATRELFHLTEELRKFYQIPMATCLGILRTMVKANQISAEVEEMIKREFGHLLFKTKIPASTRLEMAAQEKRTIFDWAGKSQIAAQYWAFSKEVEERLKLRETAQIAPPVETWQPVSAFTPSSWEKDIEEIPYKPLNAGKYIPNLDLVSFPEDAVEVYTTSPLSKWLKNFKRYFRA